MVKKPRRARTTKAADPTTAYARNVADGKIVAGPWVRLACQRHLNDLKEGPKRGLCWSVEHANRAISYFAALKLADGEHAGQPFYLEPFQCFVVGSLMGWLGADGYRRFRVGFVEIGKGNGKTPLAAAMGLYALTADGEEGAEVYSAAAARDQAHICFRDAVRFINANRSLSKRLTVGGQNIGYPLTSSFFRPLSAEGRTLDGKRVHFAILDEVHEHSSAVVVDKMRAGTKGRTQPMILEITNSGTARNSICYQHHEYSVRVLSGQAQDDGWFAYICALDEGDNWMTDQACWIKANPNLGVSISHKYLEEQVREARGMPAKQNIVARLNFCVWTDSVSAWIGREKWDAVQATIDIAELAGSPCFAGLDLSQRRDLTAVAFFFPDDEGGGDAFIEAWTPAETMADRELKDRVPYGLWVQQGFLHATPGGSVDYGSVAQRLGELNAEFQPVSMAFDRWSIAHLLRELDVQSIDIPLCPFGQGFKDMAPAVNALEAMILNGKIRIHKNPVLTWNAASAVLEEDAAGNRKFTKRRSTGRIDGLVALAMAVGAATMTEDQQETVPDGYRLMVL